MLNDSIKLFRVADLLILAAVVALAFWSLRPGMVTGESANTIAIIEIDGQPAYQLDLSQAQTFSLSVPRAAVKLRITSETIAVIENDCPAQICRKTGGISRPGEIIACVPHKLLIYIPRKDERQKSVKAITG